MTRDEVLKEFHEPYDYEIVPGLRRGGMQLNTDAMADEIMRLRQALREANRPPEDAEHHPYHWGEMADMAIDAAVRIAQSDTSRCLSCGAWV